MRYILNSIHDFSELGLTRFWYQYHIATSQGSDEPVTLCIGKVLPEPSEWPLVYSMKVSITNMLPLSAAFNEWFNDEDIGPRKT